PRGRRRLTPRAPIPRTLNRHHLYHVHPKTLVQGALMTPNDMVRTDTVRTARGAGLAYLALAVAGGLGFLVIRPQLFADDPAHTFANLTARTELARLAVALEMTVVVAQAIAAVWFYRLLRDIRPVAACAPATFGLLNSAALMASGAFMSTAVAIAAD